MHQQVQLADSLAVGEPGPLPPEIDGLDDHDLADLSWVDPSLSLGGFGFWPVAAVIPVYDPATEELGPLGVVTIDPVTRSCSATYSVVPRAIIVPTPPVRIRKYWLFERFTEDQERQFAKLEYRARNLTDTDLDDPAKEGLFQLQRFLRRLGEVEFVELDAAQTLGAFEMLRQMGVFGDPDSPDSTAALAPILAAPQPHEVA